MAQQLIGLGTTANDNTGDNLRAGGAKLNANFSELYPLANAGANAAGARRPTVAVLGDSYGLYLGAAIQWACAKYYPADIDYDSRNNAGGGRAFWVGGTTSAYMLATELPQWQARPSDIVFIWSSGRNETINSVATAVALAGNIIATANATLAGGASLVGIMGLGPQGAATGVSLGVETCNNLLKAYARANDKVVFLDTMPVMLDIANSATGTLPFRGTAGAYQSACIGDGIHPSMYSVREARAGGLISLVGPVLQRIAGKRIPRVTGARPGAFDPTNKPDVSLLGDNGLMLGTIGAGDCTGWSIAGTSGNVGATTSRVLGADGYQRQRITLSNTTTTGGYFIFQSQANPGAAINGGVSANLYDVECLLDFSGVTGLTDIIVSAGPTATLTSSNAQQCDRFTDAYTDTGIYLYSLNAITNAATSTNCRVTGYFADGVALAGYIDVYRFSCQRVAP